MEEPPDAPDEPAPLLRVRSWVDGAPAEPPAPEDDREPLLAVLTTGTAELVDGADACVPLERVIAAEVEGPETRTAEEPGALDPEPPPGPDPAARWGCARR